MTPRTIHIGASFAIVLVAYWSYALLAVPWIEPPPPARDRRQRPACRRRSPPQANDLAVLFPPDSWELRDAKIINSNGQAMLLWQKYQNHGNGWVDLTPLTIIFMPDETVTDTVERLRHAVVMEVPEGANLRFDRPLDLNKGGIGRLIEGKLRGPVTDPQPRQAAGPSRRPARADPRRRSQRTADHHGQRRRFPLGSQLGPRAADGDQALAPPGTARSANQEGPNIGGIEQFQLEHVERLHLDMGSASAATASRRRGAPPGRSRRAPPMLGTLSSHAAPVEITCRGPFRFHLIEQVATFRDQVDVLRIQPNGPCDHMSCELLSIFFTRPAPRRRARAPARKTAPGFDLQPARIEAQGTPTTLTAPLDHLQARAERLQYNLIDGQIYLEDAQEVMLQKDGNEIHAPSLRYTPGPPDHTGQFQLLAGRPRLAAGRNGRPAGPAA